MMILKTSRSNLSSNDQLSLDLPFAATKSLTARVGPTPTFTRGSGATYIGSDGLIHGVDTSTTSNTIGTGSKTFTLAATAGQDQFWRTGDAVEASNGSNIMVGTVTSYDAATQSLVCNMTTASGTGTFTSWRIGYRGPRFDHTAAGVCRGLLIEESRTNALQHSANFKNTTSSSYWEHPSATTVTVDQTTSPDGAATADLLTTSTTSFDCFVRRAINWVGSTQYSYSIFLKRGPSNHRYVGLYIGAGITGALQYPYFDFDNPTTVQIPSGTMVGTINSTRVDAYPNGWYRVSVTFTTAATPVTKYGGVYVSTSNGTLPSSSAAGLDCYIWGIQSELGAFPTSYIPTTTGTLARSADVCSITSGAFNSFYNQSEGSLFSDLSSASGTLPRSVTAIGSTAAEQVAIGLDVTRVRTGSVDIGSFYANIPILGKRVVAYASGQQAASRLGGVVSSTNAGLPSGISSLFIGGTNTVTSNVTISAIRYYKKRLPNAKLTQLTT